MASSLYDEGAPAGNTPANALDTDIQDVREDFRERLQQGGKRFSGFDSDVPETEEIHDGKPCVGWENQTDRNDEGYLTLAWDHDGTGELVRLFGPDHVTKPNVLEIPGDISGPGGSAISINAIAAGAHARATFSDPFPVTGYLKRIIYKSSDATNAPNRTLKKIKIVVGTRPVSTNLVLTLRKRTVIQQTVSNNPYDDAVTTAITDATATLVAGSNYSVEATLGTPAVLAPGEELVAIWGTTGNAGDVTVLLQVE